MRRIPEPEEGKTYVKICRMCDTEMETTDPREKVTCPHCHTSWGPALIWTEEFMEKKKK